MDREQKTLLAGELALGLLEGDERREALHLVSTDPAARADYLLWQTHFATLADEITVAEVAVPRRVRDRLLAVIGEAPERGWWQELVRMFSDPSWAVPILTVKAILILYLLYLLFA